MAHRFTSNSDAKGCRLDHYLHQLLPELSRTSIRKIIDLGGVHIDGRRVRKCSKLLTENLSIEVHRDKYPLDPFRIAQENILFEDNHLIGLNKPAGVATQPTPARYKGTLYEALQIYLKRDRRHSRKLEIGMAQRLDLNTSGVLVFSIHPHSHKGLSDQIRDRLVSKNYLALVAGYLDEQNGTFHSFLAKERRSNRFKAVPKGGKEAITSFEVLHEFSDFSLVKIQLETGRTHQIRAHFSEAGHPLLGDVHYGGPSRINNMTISRQCLHSWILELQHPVTHDHLQLIAPPPKDIKELIGNFQLPQVAI